MKGHYKKEDSGNWIFAVENAIIRGPKGSYILSMETKDETDYPVDGWNWYDEAPQEYIDWLEAQEEE